MEPGNIIEYIDQKQIICAVILEVKKQRLRVLTETNKEVNLSARRIWHKSKKTLSLNQGRDFLVNTLKETTNKRTSLKNTIDIEEMWEVLHTEREWIDLETMVGFCFSGEVSEDHDSAVTRAFFEDKTFFKFEPGKFLPNTEEQVEKIKAREEEEKRREKTIKQGGDWLKIAMNESQPEIPSDKEELIEIVKSAFLFEKEFKDYDLAKGILERAGISFDTVPDLLIKLGIWTEHENIELHRKQIPVDFSNKILEIASNIKVFCHDNNNKRRDLTELAILTIDGESTKDFDDAISIEPCEDGFMLGIHIADVSEIIKMGSPIDSEAINRSTSIYMPDQLIPMLPSELAENICSLRADEKKPVISVMIHINDDAEILDFEIFPAIINVQRQLSYQYANSIIDDDFEVSVLYDLAQKLREKRLEAGALQISLPEVIIQVDNDNINVNKIDRESPCRMLIAELMILGNWLMARFLKDNKTPAVFRSQPAPKERLFEKDQGTLFQNWMQRRLLSRFVLSTNPESHSGLGLDCYVTATSPIRKYFDLITQRQIKSVLGLGNPYNVDVINGLILKTKETVAQAGRLQFMRNRYWLFKYLEKRMGETEEAIVLDKRWHNYMVLLTNYMVECPLPLSAGLDIKPQDVLQVKLNRVDARNNVLSVNL